MNYFLYFFSSTNLGTIRNSIQIKGIDIIDLIIDNDSNIL